MKKLRPVKKGLSLILAVALLINMMPLGIFDVGIAAQAGQSGLEEEILLDEETNAPTLQNQAEASGQSDTVGLSIEGIESVTEPAGLGPSEEEISRMLQDSTKAEAELSAVSADASGIYTLQAKWNVKDTDGAAVQLALAVPVDVYEACVDAGVMTADGKWQAKTADGETLILQKTDDSSDASQILFVCEQKGDGEYTFSLNVAAPRTAAVSRITAKWKAQTAASWNDAAYTDITWTREETLPSETTPELQTDTAAESETAAEAMTELSAKSEQETESVSETGAEQETVTEAVTEPQSTVAEAATESETESEYAAETVSETAIESESTTEAITEAQSTIETASEEVTETDTESETETVTEAITESAAESESAYIESETDTEITTEETTGTEPEEATEAVTEAITESETEIGSEITTESVTEEDTEIETESEAESATDMELSDLDDDEYSASVSAHTEGVSTRSKKLRSGLRRISARAAARSVDLTDYITNVEFNKSEINRNENLKVSIDYSIYAAVLLEKGTNLLTYQLPKGLIPNDNYDGYVYDNKGKKVGTYTITKSGEITIQLDDEFFADANNVLGDISFWSHLDSSISSGDHEFTFSEKNSMTATIKIKEQQTESGKETETEKNTDLLVEKQMKRYGYAEGSADQIVADYEISISSTKGTGTAITTFNDNQNMVGGVSGTLQNLVLKKKNADGSETTLNASDYFELNKDTKLIQLKEGKELPALGAGEKYTLFYQVAYDGIENVNGNVWMNNSAEARTSTDTGRDNTNISFDHTWISKSSSYDYDNNEITWTITLNQFGGDLDGYTLSDVLKQNGKEIALPDTVTLTEYKSNGAKVGEQEITLPYQFAKGKDGLQDLTDKFVVTYKTKVPDSFHSKYDNTGTISKGDHSHGSSAGQDITRNKGTLKKEYVEPETKKEGESETESEDPNKKLYEWKVTLNVPGDGIKNGSYYEDTVSVDGKYTTAHYITKAQLEALKITYTVKGSSTEKVLPTEYYEILADTDQGEWNANWVSLNDSDGPFYGYRIKFRSTTDSVPLDIEKLFLSYHTTADKTQIPKGETWTFRNTGKFTQDGAWVSDYDSTKESNGGYLKKVDAGNGNGNYVYDETKGLLYYCISVNDKGTMKKGSGDIVVEDTLPEGTTLYRQPYDIKQASGENKFSISSSGSGENPNINTEVVKATVKIWGGYYSVLATNSYPATGTWTDVRMNDYLTWSYDEATRKLRIVVPDQLYAFHRDGTDSFPVYLFYAVQITDQLGNATEKTYTNHADMYLNGNKEASDETTTKVTQSYITKMKNEDAEASDNELAYRVIINPTGENKANGNNLTVTDTVDYTKHTVTIKDGNGTEQKKRYLLGVGLKPNSLHLYRRNEDGSKGAELDQALYKLKYSETADKFELVLTVPDGLPMILEYTYLISADMDVLVEANKTEYTFTNNVYLAGGYNAGSSMTDEEKRKGSSATAKADRLTLVKVDEDNQNVYLKGAKFELQEYTGEKTDANWTDDNKWKKIKTCVTGVDGTVLLSGMKGDIAYRLIEIEAPTNYVLDAAPHYFYLNNTKSEKSKIPEGFEAKMVNVSTGYLTLTNKKGEAEKTSIEVKKEWLSATGDPLTGKNLVDKDGNPIKGIIVQLYRSTEKNAQISETDEPLIEVMVEPNDAGDWYYVFNRLDKTDADGNVWYYYVKEKSLVVIKGGADETETDLKESYVAANSGDTDGGLTEGVVTLTNRKKTGKKSVTVRKSWTGGTPEREVPVTLYRSKTKYTETEAAPEKTITVSSYYNYYDLHLNTITAEGIRFGSQRVQVDPNGSTLKLHMTIPGGNQIQNASYTTADGITRSLAWRESDGGKLIVFTLPDVKADVTFTVTIKTYSLSQKDVKAEVKTSLASGSMKRFRLPEDAEKIGEEILTSKNSWTHTWTGLDDDWYYYVQEGGTAGYLEGYHAKYTYTYYDDAKASVKEIWIENETIEDLDETSITVTKKWLNGDGSEMAEEEQTPIQVTLYEKGSSDKERGSVELGSAHAFEYGYTNGGWSYTWEHLEKGEYYVKESGLEDGRYLVSWKVGEDGAEQSSAENACASGGTITITNQKNETAITVKKVWLNGKGEPLADEEHPDSIKVSLWEFTNQYPSERKVEEITLGTAHKDEANYSDDGWSYTWPQIPKGTYFVKEEEAPDGYLVSWKVDGEEAVQSEPQKAFTTDGTITITNQKDETSITVKKKWIGEKGNLLADEEHPDSIKVSLWQYKENQSTKIEEIMLGAENKDKENYSDDGWSYTWPELKKGVYFVEEEVPNGYIASWSEDETSEEYENAQDVKIPEGIITLTNMREESNVSVSKEWLHADGKEPLKENEHPKSIEVQLYKEQIENYNKVYRKVGDPITLGPDKEQEDGYSNNGWTYTWPTMEKGNYYVEEVGTPSGYAVIYSVDGGEQKTSAAEAVVVNGSITIANQKEATSLNASKKWNDNNNTAGLRPDLVNLKLYRTTKQLEEEVGNAVTMRIKWQPNTEPLASYGVVVQIVLYTMENGQEVSVGTAYLSAENGWSYTFTGLYKNVTEYYANTWKAGTVLPTGVGVWGGGSGDSEGFITFEGNSSLHTQSIEAKQEVAAASLIPETASAIRTTSAQVASSVTLPRADGTLYSVEDAEYVSGMDRTLDASNNWSASWENLDKTDADGNLYYYFVVEDPAPGGYSPSYEITYKGNRPINEVSSVTVTNKLDTDKPIQIDVEKQWRDFVTDHSKYSVEVTLYDSSGNKVTTDKAGNVIANPVTLNAANEWKNSWTNLNLGVYYVRETGAKADGKELTGYTTTYQSGGTELTPNESLSNEAKGAVKTTGNLVTITNTREETGIILPGTGSKYPLVFYGLGLAFLSVSAAWMLLTLKKKNKPYHAGKGGKRSGGT